MASLKYFALGVALISSVAFGCSGQASSPAESGIEGVITVNPIRPGPVREGDTTSAPLPNTAFVVANATGAVKSFTTDEHGHFHVSLGPGHYTVSMKEGRFRGPSTFEADVAAGKMTAVSWRCDTGMR